MNNDLYGLIVTGEDINGDNFSCSGEQLALLLCEIEKIKNNIVWFASDFSWKTGCIGENGHPEKLGSSDKTIDTLRSVEQFFSGVLLGFDANKLPVSFAKHRFTEDERFIDNQDAYVEIRLFDTSYFEVYFSEKGSITGLGKRFNFVEMTSERN